MCGCGGKGGFVPDGVIVVTAGVMPASLQSQKKKHNEHISNFSHSRQSSRRDFQPELMVPLHDSSDSTTVIRWAWLPPKNNNNPPPKIKQFKMTEIFQLKPKRARASSYSGCVMIRGSISTEWLQQLHCCTLTLQPACWATAGTLCRRGCTAARHTAWFASAALPLVFVWRAHTPWHLRAKTNRHVADEGQIQPRALKVMIDSLLMETCSDAM